MEFKISMLSPDEAITLMDRIRSISGVDGVRRTEAPTRGRADTFTVTINGSRYMYFTKIWVDVMNVAETFQDSLT